MAIMFRFIHRSRLIEACYVMDPLLFYIISLSSFFLINILFIFVDWESSFFQLLLLVIFGVSFFLFFKININSWDLFTEAYEKKLSDFSNNTIPLLICYNCLNQSSYIFHVQYPIYWLVDLILVYVRIVSCGIRVVLCVEKSVCFRIVTNIFWPNCYVYKETV